MSIEIPGYKIIRAIGRGGMATVYLAEQEIFEREVALKVMSKSLAEDPTFGQRFFREAKIVSQLVHPNVVTVHDVGEHNGHFYLSMEYIDGGDLKLARKRLTFRQKITAIKDIAKALQYASTKGYVHRDIKPENIMFHLSDGRAVLTDFGIARAAEAELSVTQTGVAIGTPHYMSPEQAKGQPVDGRADIYSLGVVLYLLLSGKVPFDAESAVAIGIKHITDPIPLLPQALNDMQPIIDKMMAKSPDHRYQNAASLISALDNLDMAVLEKLALEFDRNLREQEGKGDLENETPTLVSAPIRAVPRGATPTPRSALSRTQPPSSRKIKRPAESLTQTQKTEVNDAIDPEVYKEPFTVIYDNDELAGLDSGGSWIGGWLVGILIIGAFGGSIYFYLNPGDWKSLLEQSELVYKQTKNQVDGLITPQDNPSAPIQENPVEPTVQDTVERPPEKSEEPQQANNVNKDDQIETTDVVDTAVKADLQENTEFLEEGTEESLNGDDAVPPEPSEEELQALKVEEKRARIKTVEEAFLKDAGFLPDLVAAHRELLELAPEDVDSQQKLAALEVNEKKKITQFINERKFSAARKKLAQLKLLFNDTDKKEFDITSALLAKQEQIDSLLKKADSLFSSGKILAPEGENSLSVYKQVLTMDAKNTDASKGIRKVSDYYLRQASEAYAEEDMPTAEEKVKIALEVDWKNTQAEKLLENLRNLQESLAKRDLFLLQAEQALGNGQYFEPVKANAYHFYALVLQELPEDERALKGIDLTMEGFSNWIWSLVGENKFEEAKKALVTPLNMLPNEERLTSLEKAALAVIEERMVENKSVITKLLVSGRELNDLNGAQAESIKVGKSIFVIFSYENVGADVTSIEARLLDGAGNIEVAKTAINVSSGNGLTKFKFDSPVGSFPSGLYNLVLSINGTILKSSLFAVE